VYGFSTAYIVFRNLDELELNIKAHVQLYRLVASQLEQIVVAAL
jgi:hypothetical protein